MTIEGCCSDRHRDFVPGNVSVRRSRKGANSVCPDVGTDLFCSAGRCQKDKHNVGSH